MKVSQVKYAVVIGLLSALLGCKSHEIKRQDIQETARIEIEAIKKRNLSPRDEAKAFSLALMRLISANPSETPYIRKEFSVYTDRGDWDLREFSEWEAKAANEKEARLARYDDPPPTPAYKTPEVSQPPIPESKGESNSLPVRQPSTVTGTGFAVDVSYLVTNSHVVENCSRIHIHGESDSAIVVARDKAIDLALLKVGVRFPKQVLIRSSPPKIGESIMTAGFPLSGLLGQGLSVTSGNVSSLKPFAETPWFFSHTAPTQPGNSGGPIFDSNGQVIGVVQGRLNDIAVAKVTGSLPQNVNFGISGKHLLDFVRRHNLNPKVQQQSKNILDGGELAKVASDVTVMISCFRD